MIKTYLFTKDGVREDVPLDDWQSIVEKENALLWVDVRSLNEGEMNDLAGKFGLHSLAVESCIDGYQRPHLYEFKDHFYVNLTVLKKGSSHGTRPTELHLFAGSSFIITAVKEDASEAVDRALQEYRDEPSLCVRGTIYGVYLLAEDLVETYYPIVEKLDGDADRIETDMLNRADQRSLKKLFDLKRRGFEIRRILGPQRDILNELARRDFPFMEGENQVYFQDIYNRLIRLFDMLDSIREILSGSLDIYLSTISNRLNEVMKVLTGVATILVILSVITGFFGMNVPLPLQNSRYMWIMILGGMGVIVAGLLWWLRRKHWM